MARQAVASSIPAVVSSASDAAFSSDGLYRWWLRRRWQVGSDCLLFVGLNPSRADAGRDDPTLRRLMGFARLWGYSELVVLNLFGRVSPSPAALKRVRDPIGAENDITLQQWFLAWSQNPRIDLWCGWGANGAHGQRSAKGVLETRGVAKSKDRKRQIKRKMKTRTKKVFGFCWEFSQGAAAPQTPCAILASCKYYSCYGRLRRTAV